MDYFKRKHLDDAAAVQKRLEASYAKILRGVHPSRYGEARAHVGRYGGLSAAKRREFKLPKGAS